MAKHKTKTSVADPRRLGQHVNATIEFILAKGGADVSVRNDKHVRIEFSYKGRLCWFILSSTPKDADVCAMIGRSLVRRAIRQAGAAAG